MPHCPYCGARANNESIDTMESIDGPFLLAKWRCAEDPTHWWSDRTDALFAARSDDRGPRIGSVPGRSSDRRSGDRAA
jgi:hypothetical protein